MGSAWLSNFHRNLSVTASTVKVLLGDGKVYPYNNVGGLWLTDPDVTDVLKQTPTGWRYTTRNDTVEEYDTSGRLIKISDKSGYAQSLFYNASNQLDYVEDTLGRRLSFTYDAQGRVATMIDPAQHTYIYGYDANNNLTSVTYPDTTTKQYLYEDPRFPNAMTGIINQNNVRYVTWDYDANGRVIANYKPGNIERGDIAYNADGTTTVTNSRNVASTYSFINQFGVGLVSSISGPGCATCGSGDSSYQYDPANSNLLSKTVKGLTTTFANYDSKGNAQAITEAAGTAKARTTTYTYDPRFFSKVATKTEPSVCNGQSKVTTYGHDDFGNTTSIAISGYTPGCTAVSRITTLEYFGPLNQLSKIDGPRTDINDVTTFDYYPIFAGDVNSGRLARVTLANGTQARYNIQYTPTGKVLSEQRPNGITQTYTYNPLSDRLDYVSLSDGQTNRVTSWTYWPTGEVHTITTGATTANPITLTFDYDDARRLTRITNADGSYLEYKLDTEGNKEQENIYDGGMLRKQIVQTFDVYNRLETFSQANESRTTHFAPDGTLHDSLDGKNVSSEYHYDDLKRLLSSTADLGGSDPNTQNALTQYDYNVHDDLTRVTDPNNAVTGYQYDDLGNLLLQTSPDTGPTQFSYDDAGNVRTRTDAKGQLFNYVYDELNRLKEIQTANPADGVFYQYDSCPNGVGRLCYVMQNAIPANYQYTAFGEVIEHQAVQYHYDDHGRLDTLRYPSGTQLTYVYDAFGKLWRIDSSIAGVGNQPLASNIQYAAFGPLVTFQYGNGLTMNRIPDSAYRPIDITVPNVLSLTGAQYDGNGNLQSRNESLTLALYNYDALDRLDTASGSFGNRDYNFDKNGNRSSDVVNTTSTTYAYKPGSNVLSLINGGSVQTDVLGNTTSLRGMTLTYDNFNRVQTVNAAAYGYNALNQRINKTLNGVTTNYVYGLNGELLAELDANGVTQNEYYYLNGEPLALTQTTTVSPPPPPPQADVIVDNDTAGTTRSSGWTSSTNKQDYGANYRYTGSSTTQRWYRWTPTLAVAGQYDVYTWYVTNSNNSTTAPYSIVHNGVTSNVSVNQRVNGGQWVLLGRYDFAAGNSGYVQLTNASGRVVADAIKFVNVPGVVQTGPQTNVYYIHADHLGTPRAMTDANQKVIWRWDSDPFGVGAANEDPDGDGVKVTMNLRFPGQYYDAESGLHYNYHRYYDPQTGRYVTADPLGIEYDLNPYEYAYSNPELWFDPEGLMGRNGNGVIGDPINRRGPTDQSGRVPRSGNPISGPERRFPRITGRQLVYRVVANQATRHATCGMVGVKPSSGAVILSQFGLGINLMITPSPIACSELDCDKNGIPDWQERGSP